MYCEKCGRELAEGTAFCSHCGTPTKKNVPAEHPRVEAPSEPVTASKADTDTVPTENVVKAAQSEAAPKVDMPPKVRVGKLHCPKCKSRNLQTLVTTDQSVNVTAKGGGYSGGKGCLGFLLFGPFGLLCGSCGQSQKTSTTVNNTSRTFWVCQDCGEKFRHLQEWENEVEELRKTYEDLHKGPGYTVNGFYIARWEVIFLLIGFVFLLCVCGLDFPALIVSALGTLLGLVIFLSHNKASEQQYFSEKKALEETKANCLD